jgi:hypothetical protein
VTMPISESQKKYEDSAKGKRARKRWRKKNRTRRLQQVREAVARYRAKQKAAAQ